MFGIMKYGGRSFKFWRNKSRKKNKLRSIKFSTDHEIQKLHAIITEISKFFLIHFNFLIIVPNRLFSSNFSINLSNICPTAIVVIITKHIILPIIKFSHDQRKSKKKILYRNGIEKIIKTLLSNGNEISRWLYFNNEIRCQIKAFFRLITENNNFLINTFWHIWIDYSTFNT